MRIEEYNKFRLQYPLNLPELPIERCLSILQRTEDSAGNKTVVEYRNLYDTYTVIAEGNPTWSISSEYLPNFTLEFLWRNEEVMERVLAWLNTDLEGEDEEAEAYKRHEMYTDRDLLVMALETGIEDGDLLGENNE